MIVSLGMFGTSFTYCKRFYIKFYKKITLGYKIKSFRLLSGKIAIKLYNLQHYLSKKEKKIEFIEIVI